MRISNLFFEMAIILGFWESVEAKCLNLCTDNFKTSMVQILGGSSHSEAELLAPFHSIIAKSRTNSAANRKVEWICFAVKKFDECANKCPANNAKTMRMASILQWNTICNESKQNSKAFAEFVSCERHHIDKTSKKCHFMKVNEQMPLKDFCKQLVGYSHCYASVPFECSTRATEVWLRLNHAIQKSFNVLLQLSAQHLRLPNECELTMATTLPAGILSTASPILSTVSTTTTTEMPPETTTTPSPTPLYHDDKSTADDYSYFLQTDDYKFFELERDAKKVTTTPSSTTTTTAATSGIDYWVDLDDTRQNQRDLGDQQELVFADAVHFEESLTESTPEIVAAVQATEFMVSSDPLADQLNSGTSIMVLHLLVVCFVL